MEVEAKIRDAAIRMKEAEAERAEAEAKKREAEAEAVARETDAQRKENVHHGEGEIPLLDEKARRALEEVERLQAEPRQVEARDVEVPRYPPVSGYDDPYVPDVQE